jgi:thiol-disulfide isomerase/thioredoxin
MKSKYFFSGAARHGFLNLVLALLFLPALMVGQEKRPEIIEAPVFDVGTSNTIEIAKIELNNAETILHIEAFYRPKLWIKISADAYIIPGGTNEKLSIVKSEGIELDKEFFMPESGRASFKLFFPPLKDGIKDIDFIECESEGCFNFWGIHLSQNAKANIASEMVQKECKKPLPDLKYSKKPAILSGKYFGYNKMMNKDVTVRFSDFSGETEVSAKVSDDGSFTLEAMVGFPGVYNTTLGRLFLSPGQETKCFIDLAKQSRINSRLRKDKEAGDSINTFIEGNGFFISSNNIRKINNFSIESDKNFYSSVFGKTPEEYLNFIMEKYNKTKESINRQNCSADEKILSEALFRAETLRSLLYYQNAMLNGYVRINKVTNYDTITYKPENLNSDYYDLVIKNMFDDKLAYTSMFPTVISLLKHVYMPAEAKDMPVKEKFYMLKETVKPILGENSIAYDHILASLYNEQIQNSDFFTPEEKEEIKKSFADNTVYSEVLLSENDKLKTLAEGNKSLIKPIPDVEEDKVFDEIIKAYKGKVILVDVWATWCAPCRQALKMMTPLKESWKDKNIVFIYLTGETSPLATWNKMIPDIHGEHYRVSDSQWKYLSKAFSIQGVPTYMIYDKNGAQKQIYTGYPGNETMKKLIESLL